MKKLYIAIVFITCVIASFFITRRVLDKPLESKNESVVNPTDTPKAEKPITQIVDTPKIQTINESIGQSSEVKEVQPTVKTEIQSQKENKHVNISLSEVKNLIVEGTYDKDRRLSKKYTINYVEVNDDDIGELQQNLTFVQQQIEFEKWRDIEVVGIGFDEKNGLVNYIKIQPIY